MSRGKVNKTHWLLCALAFVFLMSSSGCFLSEEEQQALENYTNTADMVPISGTPLPNRAGMPRRYVASMPENSSGNNQDEDTPEPIHSFFTKNGETHFAIAIAAERIQSSVMVGQVTAATQERTIQMCVPLIEATSGRAVRVTCPDIQCPEIPESLDCQGFYSQLNSITSTYSEFRNESERLCAERVSVVADSQKSTIDKILEPWFVISMLVGVFSIMFMTLKMSKQP